jgi:hypothetical protein
MAGPGNGNLQGLLYASRNSMHEEDCEIQLSGGTCNVKTITKQHSPKLPNLWTNTNKLERTRSGSEL